MTKISTILKFESKGVFAVATLIDPVVLRVGFKNVKLLSAIWIGTCSYFSIGHFFFKGFNSFLQKVDKQSKLLDIFSVFPSERNDDSGKWQTKKVSNPFINKNKNIHCEAFFRCGLGFAGVGAPVSPHLSIISKYCQPTKMEARYV